MLVNINKLDKLDKFLLFSTCKKKKINPKYKPGKLFVEGYNYNDWNKNVESTDKEESVDLSDVLPLSNDEEDVRE